MECSYGVQLWSAAMECSYREWMEQVTISRRLAALGGEVDTLSNSASRVRHDPHPRLEDGSHHCHIRPVPQQPAIL